MEIIKTSIHIEVRSTEIDAMGHVNNAKYLEYMEWGREDWYHKIGLPFHQLTDMGIGTVVASVHIHYRKELRLGQQLTIFTEPLRRGRTSFVLKHLIYNEQEELVAEAEVISVTMDLRTRKSVVPPEQLIKQFVSLSQ